MLDPDDMLDMVREPGVFVGQAILATVPALRRTLSRVAASIVRCGPISIVVAP
jgi:hypothetical protein